MSVEPTKSNDPARILEYRSPPTEIPIERDPWISDNVAVWFGFLAYLFVRAAGLVEIVIFKRLTIEDGSVFPGGAELCIVGTVLVFAACKVRVRKSKQYSFSKLRIAIASLIFVTVPLLLFLFTHDGEAIAFLETMAWGLLFPSAVPWLVLRVEFNVPPTVASSAPLPALKQSASPPPRDPDPRR
jgi:hypothetical protein